MEPVKSSESTEERSTCKIHPLRLVMSVIALAGSILIIVAGAQMLGIRQPYRIMGAGGVGNTYYHALGLVFIGIGLITGAASVRAFFRGSRSSHHS